MTLLLLSGFSSDVKLRKDWLDDDDDEIGNFDKRSM
jgi:hypothetical protein